MADNYISTNMNTGVDVKQALERIESYQPDLFVWTEISDSVTVDLKSPTTYSGIKDPGDYVIYKFSNGPSSIPSTLSPILLSLRNGNICVTANGSSYIYDGSAWHDINEVVDDTTVIYIKDNAAPLRTKNTFWFDTSKFDGTENGYIDLKYYNETSKTWESVFNSNSYLKKSTLDPDNKNLDIFDYINEKVANAVGDYGDFLKHIDNKLTLIHVSADDRTKYAKIINATELQELINNTYKPALKSAVDTSVNSELNTTKLEEDLTTLETTFDDHINGKINTTWTQGTMPSSQRWRSVCYGNGKFVTNVRSTNVFEYSSDGINWTQGTMPSSQNWESMCYGNGKFVVVGYNTNVFAYSTDGINWTQGTMPSKQSWESMCYGNGKFVAVADTNTNVFAYSTDGINWTQGTMPSKQYWGKICYGNGKFIVIDGIGPGSIVFAYSSNGINWTQGTLPSKRYWSSVCYGNDKFVAIALNSNVFAYSSDGITWTEGTMPSKRDWNRICYGNGKFVAIVNSSTVFAYSIDGINWTQGTMPSSQSWYSVCYGNGKFVAMVYNSDAFAYSTDGIPPHITADDIARWKNKADANHTHDYTIGTTKIDGSQIVDGTFTADKLPDEIKERYYPAGKKTIDLSTTKVGDTFRLGKYQVESEDPWAIDWEIVDVQDDYQVAMTKQIIDCRPFDAKEPNNPNSDRENRGNNNWQYSNIEQFLNSDQVSWYSAQHQYDAPPSSTNVWNKYNAYNTHKGFLYYWNNEDKSLLKDMTLTLANNTVTDGSGSYTWTGKVFLPTYTQMGFGNNNNIAEGEAFSKFTDEFTSYSARIKSINKYCAENNKYCIDNNKIEGTNWHYWMSSVYPSESYQARHVNNGGGNSDNVAYVGFDGLAPCICLPRTSTIIEVENTPEEEFSNTSLTDTDRATKYHNGNAFYFTTTDAYGKLTYRWFRIIDSTKIGTSDWANGVSEFTATESVLDWNSISGRPTTLEEFGITNDLYTKTQVDEKFSSSKTKATEFSESVKELDGTTEYEFDTIDDPSTSIDKIGFQIRKDSSTFSDVKTGTIPQIDAIIKTSDHKIYKTTQNLNSEYEDIEGNKTTTKNASEPLGASMSEVYLKEYESIHKDKNTNEYSIAYGNDKFVVGGYNTFAWSTTGEVWNEIDLSNIHQSNDTNYASAIAYGNSKFVACILNNTSGTYELIYSTDGIIWNLCSSENPLADRVSSICYGNGKFVAVYNAQSDYALYSLDGITWVETSGYPSTILRSVCYGNNIYIAACSWDGISNDETIDYTNIIPALVSSINGTSWDNIIPLGDYAFGYVSFVLNKFIAINQAGEVWISTNGLSWNSITMDFSDFGSTNYPSIDYLCNNGGGYNPVIFTTHIWEYDESTAIGIFFNPNTKNFVIAKSADFKKWIIAYNLNKEFYPTNIICNNDRIVVIGNTDDSYQCLTFAKIVRYKWSTNGSTVKLSSNITIPDSKGYVISPYCDNPNLTHQTHIIDDNYQPNSIDMHGSDNGGYVFSGWSANGSTDGTITLDMMSPYETIISGIWEWKNAYRYNYSWNASDYSELTGSVTLPSGDYAVTGSKVSVDKNYTSDSNIDNNSTWTQNTMRNSQRWCSVCYGNGKFVAISGYSSSSNVFAYSSDGINWTQGTISKQWWYSVCYGNGKFIAVAYNSNILVYSTDGITWTQGTMPSKQSWESMCYGNGKFVAVANGSNNSNVFAYSSDGINWTEGTMPSQMYRSVCYGNDKFVAVVYNSNIFAYSSDGINWTEGTMPSKVYWWSVCYGNGKFVAVAYNSNVFAYSSDGITWTQGTLPIQQKWYSVCYGNGKFVAIVDGYSVFAYSNDGINWTQGTMSSNTWYSVCYGNNKFVAVAYGSNIFAYLPISTTYYNFSGWDKSDFNITENTTISGIWSKKNKLSVSYSWTGAPSDLVAQVPETAYYMPNSTAYVDKTYNNKIGKKDNNSSISWTQGTIPSVIRLSSVCYGNGKFVSVSGWNSDSNIFAYSTDGINWTQGNMPSSQLWMSVYYGNGKFVAIAKDTDVFAYSTDGITWTQGTMPSSQYWKSVCYGNGKFVAVVYNSNIFAYSTDGINWTQGTMPSSQYWYSVCYGNNKFVAVNMTRNSNIFAYSTDGTTWTQGTMPIQQTWCSVCYGNGKFVSVSGWNGNSNIFAYSTDGITWTQGTMPSSQYWSSVCYSNNKFVAVAMYSNIFAYSSDGITWTQGTMPSSRAWKSVCYGNNKFVVIANNSNIFAYTSNSQFYYQFSDWDKSDFNITENTTISGTWNKYNKYAWNYKTADLDQTWSAVAYNGSVFAAVKSNSNIAAYSYDGLNWTQASLPKTQYWSSIAVLNGSFICSGADSSHSSNIYAASSDGINWTQETAVRSGTQYNIVSNGNDMLLAFTIGSKTYNFKSGVTWDIYSTLPYAANSPACYGNGKYLVFSSEGLAGYAMYSTDGENWNSSPVSASGWSGSPIAVTYGNGKFVCISNGYRIFYSTDGITWTQANTDKSFDNIYYGNNIFIAKYSRGNTVAYSFDGINWNDSPVIKFLNTDGDEYEIQDSLYNLCYGNNKWIALVNTLGGNMNYYSYMDIPSDITLIE